MSTNIKLGISKAMQWTTKVHGNSLDYIAGKGYSGKTLPYNFSNINKLLARKGVKK